MWNVLSRRRRPAIIALHDVVDESWFRSFLAALTSRVDVVDLTTVVRKYAASSLDGGCVAITFDDGLKSIRTIVTPVCLDLGVPFTTFVCGDVLTGGPAPWYDRASLLAKQVGPAHAAKCLGLEHEAIDTIPHLLSVLKEAPLPEVLRGLDDAELRESVDPRPLRHRYMNIEDLAAVATHPLVTVGSHTFRHPILSNLEPADQRDEIKRGIEALRAVVPEVRYFAFPNGKPRDFNELTLAILREVGVQAAVTTVQRPLRRSDDKLQLPRIGVSNGDSPDWFNLKWAVPLPSLGDRRELRWRKKLSDRRRHLKS